MTARTTCSRRAPASSSSREPLSLYASYSVSYLPSSGDQFSSLTSVTETLKPEKFEQLRSRREVGRARPVADRRASTGSIAPTRGDGSERSDAHRADRRQRTEGFELGVAGNVTELEIAGGYAYQDAEITQRDRRRRARARGRAGPRTQFLAVEPLPVPAGFGAGLGVIYRSDMFAAIDDSVTLPGYTRVDGALYYAITSGSLQANIENIFDKDTSSMRTATTTSRRARRAREC